MAASALLRLLFALTLVGQTLAGPATPVTHAQPVEPVTFTPSTTSVGGTISLSARGFDVNCQTQASVQVLDASTGALVAALSPATFDCTGSFTESETLPAAVVAGSYRISVGAANSAISYTTRAVLTVTSAGLVGVAQCNVPPLTVLRFATVTVFSGSAKVVPPPVTTADANGNWAIAGSAPNSDYIVRYTANEGGVTCGVAVHTDATGAAVVSPPAHCPNPDLGNRIWLTPMNLPPSPTGIVITDSICKSGQSRWFRVNIQPGQQVTAEVLDPTFDVTLALFKDIRQAADEMNAAQANLTLEDVRRFTASIPHDVAAPDIASPDIASPDIASPDIASPDIASPDIASPDIASPDIASPDIASPDIASPDIASPDIASPDAYSAAQLQSIVAYSDKPGPSSEFVRRHTWDNTGSFYIRVRGHNDAFDESHPFNLRVTVIDRDCTGDGGRFTLNTTRPSFSNLPDFTPRTLILTNSARFPAGSDTKGLLNSLGTFAARPEVGGVVLDLSGDGGLAADYAQWDNLPDCVPAANIVASQIQAIENVIRAHAPNNLQYVVLAGGDHVLPFSRLPDEAGLSNEHDFSPAVVDFSASQASLKTGYFLSQDTYGSFTRITQRDHVTPSFDVPVGRLVENVSEIQTMLAAYTATSGLVQPTTALVAGYDFLADSSAVQRDELAASGLTVDTLIQPEGDGPLNASAWHADDLRAKLFGPTHYGILDLNSHFSANTLLASDLSSRVRSREIAAVTDHRYLNSIVMSMGCHSGYNIVDTDATPGTQRVDWAQAFAQQGATVIGGAGYQYGNSPLIKYSEVLLDSITHQLRLYDPGTAPGPVSLGRAIVEAKRAYLHGGMNGIDEKSLAELTLYGLPMMGVNLPLGRIARPGPTPPISPQTGASPGLSFADLTPSYTLNGHDRVLNLVGGGTTTATYFDADGGTFATPAQPILPQVTTPVPANGTIARGAVLLSATYTDLFRSLNGANGFRPLVDNAPADVRGVRPAYASSILAPAQVVQLNDLGGQFLIERPFQFRSIVQPDGTNVFGTGRRYDAITSRVYYSNRLDNSALAGPPVIYTTSLSQSGNTLSIDVTVGGLRAADIETVFATFTADRTEGSNVFYGHWASIPLRAGPSIVNTVGFVRHYTGSIDTTESGATPGDLRVFIQAVGGNGLVSQATNNGSYFRLITETATLGSPKAATTVGLRQGAGVPYEATYRSTLHLIAQLSSSGAPVSNKTLTFSLGRSSARGTTAADGTASVDLPVLVVPDSPPPRVAVEFAEDNAFLGSSDRRDVTVHPAPTTFVLSPASIAYGGSSNIAVLVAQVPSGNKPLGQVGVRIGLNDGRLLDTVTDGFGQVLFDTLDFEGVQPGTYATTLSFAGNERYQPTSTTLNQTVTTDGNHSLAVHDGGYAEVPDSSDLTPTGSWTVEMWFKDQGRSKDADSDEDAAGGVKMLINKGDAAADEVPYFVRLQDHALVVGFTADGNEFTVRYDLENDRQFVWHHLAATFDASKGMLVLYVDGRRVARRTFQSRANANTLPLEIGRQGPGNRPQAFNGNLDDIRIWNVARTAIQIQTSFRRQLASPEAGLVANWKFDERLGTFLAYSMVGGHTATLSTTGAAFSMDVHP